VKNPPAFETIALYAAAVALAFGILRKAKSRLELSLAKHRSLAGHPRTARRIASFIPSFTYEESTAFGIDGAPIDVVARRKAAFDALVTHFRARYPQTLRVGSEVAMVMSDLQFVSAYRVPFQFRKLVQGQLQIGSLMQASEGLTLTDLDGNKFFDLTGSYGVNVFGNDFYKECIDKGAQTVRDLGPVLGSYHPVIQDNVHRLLRISGMEEITFHMSGTEAVMQAVRLARYHSRRSKIVRFCGSYHGWWGDVQPGIGNPMPARDTFTLAEMSEATLRVLRKRTDIACILINPLQALHPNAAAPSDGSLLDSSRNAGFSKPEYTAWLQQLRSICDERGIALIFDEVFVGFRLARGGAQEYFGVCADLVTYGKTIAGGLPIGAVCGKRQWMKRFRDDAPADICFARGTFNSHPYVMGAMNTFLVRLDEPDIACLYTDLDSTWNSRAQRLNEQLAIADIPVRVANMSSIWTVLYTQPACFNWLLQHYLRLEGLALSWVGTGRIIFSLNFTESDFEEVSTRFVRASLAMKADGWWWMDAAANNKAIRRRILREMLAAKF
jgi:glutamate-1-semialdehyde 2,1-aminomutase